MQWASMMPRYHAGPLHSQVLLDPISVLQLISLFLIVEDPADNFADANIVVDINLRGHSRRAFPVNVLSTFLHFLQAFLPDSEVSGAQVDPAFFSPNINVVVCNHYLAFKAFRNADIGSTNYLRSIGYKNWEAN